MTHGQSLNGSNRPVVCAPVPAPAARSQHPAGTITPTGDVSPDREEDAACSAPSGTDLRACMKETHKRK